MGWFDGTYINNYIEMHSIAIVTFQVGVEHILEFPIEGLKSGLNMGQKGICRVEWDHVELGLKLFMVPFLGKLTFGRVSRCIQ